MKVGHNIHNDFAHWNKLIFCGELWVSDLRLETKKSITDIHGKHFDCAGYTEWDSEDIDVVLSSDYCTNWTDYHATLLHEMVHVWQIQKGKKVGHGKTFKAWAKYIAENFGHII